MCAGNLSISKKGSETNFSPNSDEYAAYTQSKSRITYDTSVKQYQKSKVAGKVFPISLSTAYRLLIQEDITEVVYGLAMIRARFAVVEVVKAGKCTCSIFHCMTKMVHGTVPKTSLSQVTFMLSRLGDIFSVCQASLNFILIFSKFSTRQTALATLLPSKGSSTQINFLFRCESLG